MQYNQPLDQPTVPNAPYVDGNPQAGIQGSIVPAASIEFDQREIVEVITRANVRGYQDFTGAACAPPSNGDLTELRKAIEGFIGALVLPQYNPYLITTEVTFTVHGPGAKFADLNAAMIYLSAYKITQTGHVILQLAGATSGHATQYVYSRHITFNHPNNDRISVLGAPMLAPLPLSDAGYASNGPSAAQRAADLVTNLAILRNHFATELHFGSDCGIQVTGLCLMHLDSILVTGDGTGGDGFLFNCSGYLNEQPTSVAGNWAYGGLAAAQVANSGFAFDVGSCVGISGQALSQNLITPLVAIGCSSGVALTNGGFLTTNGNVICLGNSQSGFYGWPRAGNQMDGGVFCCSNGGHGYQAYLSPTNYIAGPLNNGAYNIGPSHFYKNGGYGIFGESSHMSFNADCGSGANANAAGSVNAINACAINVWTDINVSGHCSPPLGVVGNGNSIIQTGW